MPSLTAKLLADLATVLERRSLRWYVFGAQAVLIYGRPRLTEDVDVTVFLDGLHHRELQIDLSSEGFELDPVADEDFIESSRVLPFLHKETGMGLDLVLGGPGLEELFVAAASESNLGGIRVPVISAEHLLVTKVLAGRQKDLDDARGVISASGKELKIAEIEQLLEQLELGLERSDLRSLFASLCSA